MAPKNLEVTLGYVGADGAFGSVDFGSMRCAMKGILNATSTIFTLIPSNMVWLTVFGIGLIQPSINGSSEASMNPLGGTPQPWHSTFQIWQIRRVSQWSGDNEQVNGARCAPYMATKFGWFVAQSDWFFEAVSSPDEMLDGRGLNVPDFAALNTEKGFSASWVDRREFTSDTIQEN